MLAPPNNAQTRFDEIVTDEQGLRKIAGQPSFWFQGKVLAKLDAQCRRFIAQSPFIVMSSAGTDGHVDTSPKGDEPGFVRIVDDTTLAVPDRPGNRRFDTFRNLLQNPNIGLIFFVPGRRETLRIGGKALIVRDRALRETMAAKGRLPELATVVLIERASFHCGSCIARANLWRGSRQEASLADAAMERTS